MADARSAGIAALVLLLSGGCTGESPVSVPQAEPARLPERLSGRYAMRPANCDMVLTDDRLIIAPLRISFHESAGEVTSVTAAGPDRWQVTLAIAGEGERWTRTEMLRLVPGGRTVALGPMLWHRCAV